MSFFTSYLLYQLFCPININVWGNFLTCILFQFYKKVFETTNSIEKWRTIKQLHLQKQNMYLSTYKLEKRLEIP